MRVIDAVISKDRAEKLQERAREAGHRWVVLEEGELLHVRITCERGDPDEFLSDLREDLREREKCDEHYVVFEPMAVEPMTDEEDEGDEDEEAVAGTDEIEAFVAEGARVSRSFIVVSVLAGVIAAAGLLRNSSAVVVGSMVLAPLFKPIALAGVAVLLGKPRKALLAVMWLLVSLGLSSVAALVTALLTPDRSLTSLIELRTGISPFDVAVALAAGLAMAFVLVRRDSMAMVGIVVAASLMPVAAALGVVIAMGRWDLVGGAAFTLASNCCGVLLGLVVGLRIEEVRGADAKRERLASLLTGRSLIVGSVILLGLGGFGAWSYWQAKDEPRPALRGLTEEQRELVLETFVGGSGRTVVVVRSEDAERARAVFSGESGTGVIVVVADGEYLEAGDRP